MLTLADINALPNDPNEDHLRALGLLPQPPAPVPIIPPASGKIPTPSPVTPAPAVSSGWKEKLAGTIPHAAAPLPPLTTPIAPDMGTPAAPTTGPETPLGGTNFPKLAPLNFKERQALPTTSAAAPIGSAKESLAELARLQDQKNNPWGSPENHPGIGGKIGHVAARIGNIAGDILAPATMANIPGTDLNKQVQERRLEGQVAGREKAEEAAKTGESERELRTAEAEEAKARAKKLGGEEGTADILQDAAGNAVGWKDEKGALHSLDEEGTPAAIKAIAEKWEGKQQAKSSKENLQQGLAGAVQDALDNGRDPKTDPKVQGWQEAIQAYQPKDAKDIKTAEDLKQRIAVAFEKGDIATVKQLQGELQSLDPEGMARLRESQARAAESMENARASREDREEKQGLKWVTGETAEGKTVTVPLTQAKAMGLKNMAEANADHVNKVLASRVVVPMLYSTDPADPGVVQIVDKLDKEGELGVLASRWNDFMVRRVGDDPTPDQLFTRLRTRLDLAQTKMMQAHVGNRGGAFMLEHFQDLADARKLDAKTLRAALDEELHYMARNSEKPSANAPSSGGAAGPKKGDVVDGYVFNGGDPGDKKNWKKQ